MGKWEKMTKQCPEWPGVLSPQGRRGCYGMGGKVLQPLLKDASIHTVNFAIVKIICKICIINIIKSLVGKTSDMTRVKGSLGRTGL